MLPLDIIEFIANSPGIDVKTLAMLSCTSRVIRSRLLGWESRALLALPPSYDKELGLVMPNAGLSLSLLTGYSCQSCGSVCRVRINWQYGVRWCRDCLYDNIVVYVDRGDVDGCDYISYDHYCNGVTSVVRFCRKKN